jgi:hypothetical protein
MARIQLKEKWKVDWEIWRDLLDSLARRKCARSEASSSESHTFKFLIQNKRIV